ncbi:acyl-CoA carboxylase subunit epsilon [Streptomyces sp. NPDC056149]|uniref:acyl-CoA carboxylase subunit epsilon n=1 Tax=unclassified Streptomyces TaxID=2593676 RepID=UPI0023813346|nr:acyl-CoA carboxylase subunit epsilon [Streptomyces sp. WZ-12]
MTRPTEDDPAEMPLRIVRGNAEPEELAALAVVVCSRLAWARALADGDREQARDDGLTDRQLRNHRARSACWAGCWLCG